MCGDAIISNDGGTFVVGLPLNEFRTFRFQTTGDNEYCVWYDGRLFLCDFGDTTSKIDYLQLRGSGGISPTQNGPIINRWDYVRYGRVTSGEVIVGATPPGGILDAAQYPKLDRFIVTFDQPNYVYVADIVVDVIANQYRDREGAASMTGNIPIVIATRRQDNGPPETVEIVLDWPLAVGTTTRFTFNTGGTSNTVEYTLVEFDPCCLPSGLCADLESNDCTAQGGTTASSGCEGDTDSDGRDAACGDACPTDPTKFAAGQCGCGVPDTDSDSDTIADCLDQCPTDSAKTAPGQCGCGLPDTDSDSDTIADCLDQCPGRDDRIDADSNNIPDCLESPFIPTASTWGLAILTLLLITAAKLFFPHSVPRKAS